MPKAQASRHEHSLDLAQALPGHMSRQVFGPLIRHQDQAHVGMLTAPILDDLPEVHHETDAFYSKTTDIL